MPGLGELVRVPVQKPDDVHFVFRHSHFIKTVEDLHETMAGSVPSAKFGLAFCEASADCLVRLEGNDRERKDLAEKNALAIGAGHSSLIFMGDCYPINVLNAIKNVVEVCAIYCATANPVEVVVAVPSLGRRIMGIIDGFPPKGVEDRDNVKERTELLLEIRIQEGRGSPLLTVRYVRTGSTGP